jgi:hypothetical protein
VLDEIEIDGHASDNTTVREDRTFESNNRIPDYKLPIETRLVRTLRIWQGDRQAMIDAERPIMQEICMLVEGYIGECLAFGSDAVRGWWSDGVMCLEIQELATGCFKLYGVSWIGTSTVAPFEIDVDLLPENDTHFARTVFRIGTLDKDGHPTQIAGTADPRVLLRDRPRFNSDWAVAIELTAPTD